MDFTRRNLLKTLGISVAGGIFIPGISSRIALADGKEAAKSKKTLPMNGRKRVVILGGGYAGLYCAITLRNLSPEAEIVVVEKHPFFVSGPSHVDYVAGLKHLDEFSRGYDAIAGRNIQIIRSEVINVDPGGKKVITASGDLEYHILVIATGIRIVDEDVLNLIDHPASNSHAWELGETVEMRTRVAAFRGGKLVITVPTSPFKCPPGPYEVACLLREYFDGKKIKAEIIIMDANDKPQPGPLAQKWTSVLESKKITYMPNSKVIEIDVKGKRAVTDKGEKVAYDLISIIPPNKAAGFIKESGLGDPFADVDPTTFRSKKYDNIFAVGDCAKVPYTKSAYTATLQGKSVAHHVARAMGLDIAEPAPIHNICFPYVSSDEALLVRVEWDKEGKAVKTEVDDPKKEHVKARGVWENGIINGLFGA